MINLIAIAAGGAVGALLRHGVNMMAMGMTFPWSTLFVNVSGSLCMGLLVGAFASFWDVSQGWKLFLTVGLLGAFTTFSAFSLDAVLMLQKGQILLAFSYILGSVILSLGALVLGLFLMRIIPS